ncbi:MAG: hypothetical protein EOO77_27430 [Oxalobacteraceae bacterium]|nr:MAG: hypothetical protein EOO77_27430 [Oxalobacteraceae bacterium]
MDIDDIFGLWTVTETSGRFVCSLALSRFQPAPFRVQVEQCEASPLQHARQWGLTPDGVLISDKSGAAIIAFRPSGRDVFESADGRFRMSRAASS